MSVIDSSYRPRRIHKLLVANRGEIALRVIRAARELGMRSVAVYSDADHDALATRMADEAVHIGPAHATRSYLNVDAVLKAARETGAQAVHPGYGFLSENAAFAQAVSDAGLIFVGPDAETIRKMGDKAAARACAQAAGVPTVPGSAGVVSSLDEALTHAGGMGYPDDQGGGRRRRARHPRGAGRGRAARADAAGPGRGAGGIRLWRRLSGTLPAARGTSKCRCWATARTPSIFMNANARCSGVARRCSRKRPRPRWTPPRASACANRRRSWRARSAIAAPARWSSCTTTAVARRISISSR